MVQRDYWLNLFTGKTWQEFLNAGAQVTGFRAGRRSAVRRVEPGDCLLCYLTGVSRWIGALEVTDLGVTKTHNRPYTSTDNPYSEAHFKTLKYRPGFPPRFDSIEHARAFCRGFFDYYNNEHRHCGIGLMTPASVHHGRAERT